MSRYSVIIATHRRAEWLKRAVASVKSQSPEKVDVIVVSDVACAETYSAVSPLLGAGDLFIQHARGAGPAESRNIGIELLTSDYAFFLDDDDEIPPDFIAAVDEMRPQNFSGIVYSDFAFKKYDADGSHSTSNYSIAANNVEDIYVRNFIPNSCLVYPTKELKNRRFDSTLPLNEDWDFLLNAKSGLAMLHVPVEGPIIHKTPSPRRGNSNDHHLLLESYISIYRKWPAPTTDLKLKRQSLLAQNGIALPISIL
jgi:glycosyltransferase involved in cell wall biosynthesis